MCEKETERSSRELRLFWIKRGASEWSRQKDCDCIDSQKPGCFRTRSSKNNFHGGVVAVAKNPLLHQQDIHQKRKGFHLQPHG